MRWHLRSCLALSHVDLIWGLFKPNCYNKYFVQHDFFGTPHVNTHAIQLLPRSHSTVYSFCLPRTSPLRPPRSLCRRGLSQAAD